MAAANHRLAWIHPFVDGNGRVVRMLLDTCFLNEGLNSAGLWSFAVYCLLPIAKSCVFLFTVNKGSKVNFIINI